MYLNYLSLVYWCSTVTDLLLGVIFAFVTVNYKVINKLVYTLMNSELNRSKHRYNMTHHWVVWASIYSTIIHKRLGIEQYTAVL